MQFILKWCAVCRFHTVRSNSMLQYTRVKFVCRTTEVLQIFHRQSGLHSALRIANTKDFHSSVYGRLIFASKHLCVGTKGRRPNTSASIFLSAKISSASNVVSKSSLLWRKSTHLDRLKLSRRFCNSNSDSESCGMDLKEVVSILKKIASPSLAGSWDNVGLLLEPSPPHTVNKLLLTNDLTPPVMQEAVDKGVNMIISYHPPIFAPMKRVTQSSWKERIAVECLERRIALYSPHTSWDALAEGINDWLISAFDVRDVKPVEQTEEMTSGRNKKLTFWTTATSAQTVATLSTVQQNPAIHLYTEPVAGGEAGEGQASTKVCIQCPAGSLPAIMAALQEHCIAVDNVECCDLAKVPRLGYGMGRVGQLQTPVSVEGAVSAIKAHLNLPHVRLAQAADKREIQSVAVCAGSGSSVLRGVKADLYLTGEMSHHEVLDAACKGTHVVLCDHSNSERGFLKVMRGRLAEQLAARKVQVIVSETDRDPLVVV